MQPIMSQYSPTTEEELMIKEALQAETHETLLEWCLLQFRCCPSRSCSRPWACWAAQCSWCGRWAYLQIISDHKICVFLYVTSCNCRSFRQQSRSQRLWRFNNLFGHRETSASCTTFTSIPCHYGSPPTTITTASVVSDRTRLNTLNAQKRACTVARCRSRAQKSVLAAIIQDTGA